MTERKAGSDVPDSPSAPTQEGNVPPSDQSTRPETDLRRRASVALLVAGSWGVMNLTIAFFGNLVLARLLDPRAFGIVAVGSTVMLICSALAEGGLGSALLRQRELPSEPELRTLSGVQLVITGILAIVIGLAAWPFGEVGQVTTVMVCSVPIASLQAPGRVLLAREMRMRQITAVEAAAVVGFYSSSIFLVAALGLGVWGLAIGTVVRAVCGTTTMSFVPGGGLRRPTLELIRVFGPLIRFGVRYQANWIAIVVRDQGINIVTGLTAGVYTLGLWSLTTRLLQVPAVLYEAIGRVTFPTMAHILSSGRDPRPLIERAARLSATASAILFSAFIAGAPGFIPALFGEQWAEVVSVMPSAGLGLMISGSISAGAVGYLFAAGKPGTVLISTVASGLVWIGVAAILLPLFGLIGLGIGWILGAVAEGVVLAPVVRRLTGAGIATPLLVPLIVGSLGCALGWTVTTLGGESLLSAVAGSITAASVTSAGLMVFYRAGFLDLARIFAESVRDTFGRSSSGPATD